MSTLSNDFHELEDAIKAEAETILADFETVGAAILSDLTTIVQQAEPLIIATAKAAASAALANVTGGISAVLSAAGIAAVTTLESQGKTLADSDLVAIQATVASALAPATVVTPTAPAVAPSGTEVSS
jgi:hypothetical protein